MRGLLGDLETGKILPSVLGGWSVVLLAPRVWTSSLQNSENKIPAVLGHPGGGTLLRQPQEAYHTFPPVGCKAPPPHTSPQQLSPPLLSLPPEGPPEPHP